jgi:riboflavin synthase
VVGSQINLERALKVGDELGGHIVSGHVDCLVQVTACTKIDDSHRLNIEIPESFAGFVAEKGSVCLDGVSLTVNEVGLTNFSVNIIDHTWQQTTLGSVKAGSVLNLEIDMLARYMARLMQVQNR